MHLKILFGFSVICLFVLLTNVTFYLQNIRLELTTSVDDLIAGARPHYHVHFPFQHVLPKLTRARFNGQIYCSGPPEPRK